MKKILKFYRWFIFSFFIMMNGCVLAQDGERFGIGIASDLNNPRLEYAILINDEHTIRVDGAGSHVGFGTENGVIIPDEIEFLWRAVGEKVPHSEKMKLREKIPNDVLQKISGNFTIHYFSIDFFVLNNKPYFRWNLTEILPGQTSNFKKVSRGGHW
jgi:hypothetical protein